MTIEALCDLKPEELKQVIDSGQLAKIAEEHGWLKITRPELAEKPKKSSIRKIGESLSDAKQEKLKRARDIAFQFGFDLGDF